MNANSAGSKKKKNAAAKKKANAVVTDVPTAISQVPPSAATSIPNQYPLSPSSAPIDIVYNATADKADQTVEFYQEDEVQKFLSADHPLEMKSLASTMSLGELSHDVPTVVQSSQPVSSLLSIMISMLFCAIISVVGDCTNATSQHSTDCGDCNVVSAETWTVLQPSKRSVLLSISTALNACESIGVEEALTDKISSLLHHLVDRVFAWPVHVLAFILAVFDSLHNAVMTLINLWWSWTVWWVCLPFNLTMYAVSISQSIAVNLLVLFLNHAPGGHRVLRALNGHLTSGHRQH